jgi:hypothetical protein
MQANIVIKVPKGQNLKGQCSEDSNVSPLVEGGGQNLSIAEPLAAKHLTESISIIQTTKADLQQKLQFNAMHELLKPPRLSQTIILLVWMVPCIFYKANWSLADSYLLKVCQQDLINQFVERGH